MVEREMDLQLEQEEKVKFEGKSSKYNSLGVVEKMYM